MISGYWSEMYAKELAGWNSTHFQAQTRQGPATEWVWMNYPEPTELHDYRYIGGDFRERENIKKRLGTIKRKIGNLSEIERRALLETSSKMVVQTPPEMTMNYRERERIKKKVSRWVEALQNMPEIERKAHISALKGESVDYNALGSDFRERGKIKRRIERWVARMERQPERERQALFMALDNLR
jgi:hypothetical protein